MKRPTRWLKLEVDISTRANQKNVKYLYLFEVKQLAAAYQMNNNELESFLKFHNSMGDFVYFSEPQLQDIIIIDPQWLVDAFKALITAHTFLEGRGLDTEVLQKLKNGAVSRSSLETLWKRDDVDFLVGLMKKFDLLISSESYGAERETFLIPCMLPKSTLNMTNVKQCHNMIDVYRSFHQESEGSNIAMGTFHRFLARCNNNTDWELIGKYLSYSDASLRICRGIRLVLFLLEKDVKIEVWRNRKTSLTKVECHLPRIRRMLRACARNFGLSLDKDFFIEYQHLNPNDHCLVRLRPWLDQHGKELTYMPVDEKCEEHREVINLEQFRWLFGGSIEYEQNITLASMCQGEIDLPL